MGAPRTPFTVEPKTKLGLAIRSTRQHEGLTQKEFAVEMKVSRWTVSMWELGEIVPEKASIKKLERKFNVSLPKEMKPAIVESFKVDLKKEAGDFTLPANHRFTIAIQKEL